SFVTPPPAPEIYTLSLHDALPISDRDRAAFPCSAGVRPAVPVCLYRHRRAGLAQLRVAPRRARHLERQNLRTPAQSLRRTAVRRSEEHTSELQSLRHLVCRLLLEK